MAREAKHVNKNIARSIVYGTYAEMMGFAEAQDFYDDGTLDEIVSAASNLGSYEEVAVYAHKKAHLNENSGNPQEQVTFTEEEIQAERSAGLDLYH